MAAAHPGYAATNLQSGQGHLLLEAAMKVANLVVAQSDAQGAWPSLYAATMPDVRPGDYWGPALAELRGVPKRVGRSDAAQDDVVAALLWERSARAHRRASTSSSTEPGPRAGVGGPVRPGRTRRRPGPRGDRAVGTSGLSPCGG